MSDKPENWLETLPEPLRAAPFIGKAESLDDAIGKLSHAAKLVGTSIRIPGEDASDDDRKAFYDKLADVPGVAMLPDIEDADGQTGLLRKLGAPEKAEDYALPEIEEFEWDEGVANDLRAYAAEAGLTKAQFKRFATKIGEQERQAGLEAASAQTEAQKKLRQDWGADYDNREALIRGWMEKTDAPESMRQLVDDGNMSVEAMNWLYNTAKSFEGDVNPINRDRQGANPSLTPADAREKINEIMGNPAYWNAEHPLHKEYVQRVVKLHAIANGQSAA